MVKMWIIISQTVQKFLRQKKKGKKETKLQTPDYPKCVSDLTG